MKTKDVLNFVIVTILSFFLFVMVNKIIQRAAMIHHNFFAEKQFTIDTMKVNGSYKKYFIYKNKTSKKISIRNITKGCSCSKLDYTKNKKVKPKAKDSVLVIIKPINTGYFKESFYVYYNDSSIPDTLTVSGYVK